MAMRHGEIAVVYVDHRHDDVVAATEAESDTEPLVAVVRNAAAVFRDRDTRASSGPFAAADIAPVPFDAHKGPAPGHRGKAVRGGLPGLGKRK